MDPALYIWPGDVASMPVYLDVCGDCFCLGGFTFTAAYDASILSVIDVTLGDALLGGEYWNFTYDVAGPGTIRFVFINDLPDQNPAQPLCGLDPTEPIFEFELLLDPGQNYPEDVDFCVPICFTGDFESNSVSAPDGYHVWIPDGCDDAPDSTAYGTLLLTLECGNVKILGEHNIVIGDINLNGYPFEVGDVVLLINHLIDPDAYPFSLRQMYASDVNGDGLQATIADLIWMINYINGIPGGKVAPLDVIATVSMPIDASGSVDVMISSATNVGGALVSINHNGIELGVPIVNGQEAEYFSDNGEVLTVLVTNAFAPGDNVLFTLPVLSEGELTFGDVSISDNRGALLDARSELITPLPTEFTVSQNFPNPFNARTKINFAIPGDANVRIDIYNVAGQLVESIDNGYTNAGQHSVVWDASNIASGVYFYKVAYGNDSRTMKMTLLK